MELVGYTDLVVGPIRLFFLELIAIIPKLIFALIIWFIGKWVLDWAVKLLDKVDFKKYKSIARFKDSFAKLFLIFGKILLFLIIMDYLGVGSSVVGAIVAAFSFAIAITLGIAFGYALRDDAKSIVEEVKKELMK